MAANLDLTGGMAVARLRHGREMAGLDRSWQAHADKLQRQLNEANQQNVFMTALHEANNYILQLALDALQRARLNPLCSARKRVTRFVLDTCPKI